MIARSVVTVTAFVCVALCLSVWAWAQKGQKVPPAQPIDLNTATMEQLESLPGVGPATARAIVKFREKSGPFRRVEDLLAIKGITKKKLEAIRPYVKAETPPPRK